MNKPEISEFIKKIPKVELHVHLEGAMRAETLQKLSRKNHIELPVQSLEEIKRWTVFSGFPDFNEKYILISRSIQSEDDIYLIAQEFLEGQAAQNIRHSEVTYTAYTHLKQAGIPISNQMVVLKEASLWAEQTLGTDMQLIIDIARETSPDEGILVAEAAVRAMHKGVVALGLGGNEVMNPPKKFTKAFAVAREAGLPCILHAGETAGPESVWEALKIANSLRIGHGIRCLEDPALVEELRERQIPLEVCPTSNVCLGIVNSLVNHPLPRLIHEGLYVTINSDDPALFSTNLNAEYQKISEEFGFSQSTIRQLIKNGIQASFLSQDAKGKLVAEVDEY
ncbi:MAG: adenosine deaminase [Anaerolineaceae bacterium]